MKQEKRISYRAGITRTPSDFLCQDGELAECINLTTDNEEIKPVVQPSESFTLPSDYKLLYLHKFSEETRYICQTLSGIMWKVSSGGSWATLESGVTALQVTSIGKVLIVSTTTGILYYLWKASSYKSVTSIPDVTMRFSLKSHANEAVFLDDPSGFDPTLYPQNQPKNQVHSSLMTGDTIVDRQYTGVQINTDKQSEFNDLVVGLYSKNKSLVAQKKGFCLPFFIRYALRMYDGTYINISNPILMCPACSSNSYMRWYHNSHVDDQLIMFTSYAELFYSISVPSALSSLSDIVKSVDIFVSQGIDLYDLASDQMLRVFDNNDIGNYMLIDGTYRDNYPATVPDAANHWYRTQKASQAFYKPNPSSSLGEQWCLDVLKHREMGEVLKEIGETAIFYKICSMKLESKSGDNEMGSLFDSHTLETLTSRDRLSDDYFSRSKMVASVIYAYNSRLNLANVSRTLFEGFGNFLPFDADNGNDSDYDFYVTINTESGDKIVKHTEEDTKQKQGIWFFYPDQRATHVVIMKGGTCVCDADLNECKLLNGAYYLKGLPGLVDEETVIGVSAPTPSSVASEELYNQVVTSEVYNPWVYDKKGYNRVGTGKILGISTCTQALSQSMFGPYPLLVFSESGIWAMAVDKTGLYESMDPISRDIVINPACITQVDNAVFFVTKKGLMVAAAEGNYRNVVVHCVSERINGKTFNTYGIVGVTGAAADWAGIITACQDGHTFLDYIKDSECMMAYDYIDSRLLIINARTETVNNVTQRVYNFAYVYNMADGSFSKIVLTALPTSVVNNYPDYLMQSGTSVYTLYDKPREEEVQTRQKAFLMTRPMKMAAPLTVTSLRELVNVGTWQKKDAQGNELSKVKTEVWLSDDMVNWHLMSSRFGAAARYFRIGLFIDMLPTERLSGTIMMEQERRTDNKRA